MRISVIRDDHVSDLSSLLPFFTDLDENRPRAYSNESCSLNITIIMFNGLNGEELIPWRRCFSFGYQRDTVLNTK